MSGAFARSQHCRQDYSKPNLTEIGICVSIVPHLTAIMRWCLWYCWVSRSDLFNFFYIHRKGTNLFRFKEGWAPQNFSILLPRLNMVESHFCLGWVCTMSVSTSKVDSYVDTFRTPSWWARERYGRETAWNRQAIIEIQNGWFEAESRWHTKVNHRIKSATADMLKILMCTTFQPYRWKLSDYPIRFKLWWSTKDSVSSSNTWVNSDHSL